MKKGITRFHKFMQERHAIYLRRKDGYHFPWTKDPILQKYKFTNVYRELDRVTIWIDEFIRKPFAYNENLWFMLCIARQINHPETLHELITTKGAFPIKQWNPEKMRQVMLDRQARGEKVYTGAYIINAMLGKYAGTVPSDKAYMTTHIVLDSVWQDRKTIKESLWENTLEATHKALMGHHGWGGFMAYEVVSDLRHTNYLNRAKDIRTWAHAGPGAKRGLNRIFEREVRKGLSNKQALEEMRQLLTVVGSLWEHSPRLEMREIEHSLCEFDKYERVRLGEGKPRSLFQPIK